MIDYDKTKRAERIVFVTIGLLFLWSAAAKTDVRSLPSSVYPTPLDRAASVLEGGEALG